ncbi:radical SAM protein [Desulfatitalea alkaliphila]|uniref:7-carboxy-7-deazaguanine synthase n=1 Tax=Desulfatitalea alkaliphila TaxID=2929485 RepID=A0AA41R6F0_9BACT|nr:radical SAM protein [Desulfatitalea alkaliphila]MCJ8502015.1 radical SAM protein [Desulfatitalea alkaliphila]
MSLTISEIFHSIQGESSWAGLPFVFVRLTGCNLRCRYCDTRYAYDGGQPMTVDAILQRIAAFGCPRVLLTGGEPLLQGTTPQLAEALSDRGYTVTVETNGSLDIGVLDARCHRIMDIKCPSSGMQHHQRWANLDLLAPGDEVKFVVADRDDFQYALDILPRLAARQAAERILFSPAQGILPPRQLADWLLATRTEARLQLQLHKILWPDQDRGV